MANTTQHHPGATHKARRDAWLARLDEAWAAVPDQVRENRRSIADLALAHPSVAGLHDGSVARIYAVAAIRRYADSPLNFEGTFNPEDWAFKAALNDLATSELKQDRAVALGKTKAKSALKEAFRLFHKSHLAAVKAELAAAS